MRTPIVAGEWTFAPRGESLTVSPDAEHATVWSFDLEGRPISWFEEECAFKRSLASEVHGREQFHGARRRWRVPPAEARDRFARMLRTVATAPTGGLDPSLRRRLDDVLRWTPDSLLAEKQRFDAAYRPIGILPPDQYLSVVLQATFGCSWSRCAFCDFYQDRPFEARPLDEFRRHGDAVVELLGRAAALRKWIFLADGNALVLSNERLRPIFREARERFPGRPIAGFVDVLTGERKGTRAWSELRDEGLARVHVGIETGHDALLSWMNKPGSAAAAIDLVSDLAEARIAVAVIFMVGVGGARWAREHECDSISLLERLPLGAGDIVYLSPFLEPPGSAYARLAAAEGIVQLEPPDVEAQLAALRSASLRAHPRARVARYDLREFVY